jgi:OPT family oligopeptide transporter
LDFGFTFTAYKNSNYMENTNNFKPYISPENRSVAEFTIRAIVLGSVFGILFGAATVYMALKAGLTVSASIPIAVLAISLGQRFFKTSILENNIIQTAGSAGESVAAGVVFTLPAFVFWSEGVGQKYFDYWTILTMAIFGGILGVLMMIPLRRSLIVKEHGTLPYPEGTACAQVLIAGDKGGDFAKMAYYGLGASFVYAVLQKVFHVIAETPAWVASAKSKYLPAATVAGEITPEYLGVGYIIGPRIAGVLVAGGVLAAFAITPLLATLLDGNHILIANQLTKLNLMDVKVAGGRFDWNPATGELGKLSEAIYRAYIRQIGAGAVAGAGFITLFKTLPTIVSSFKESLNDLRNRDGKQVVSRTEHDLSLKVVGIGCAVLILLMAILPNIPGNGFFSKLLLGGLVIIFGFFFVTVSSRIVGIIGTSNNPISGMTIATIMGTALVFIGMGWTGKVYEPMALVIGGMICIAASNAGATSQDLKTGYIIGATPRYQQLSLFIGVIISSLVIGMTVLFLDTPTKPGYEHAIGNEFNAPQATLMATLIKGLLSFNLDWQFVLVGLFVAITLELCSVKSLSFAVGLYLPLATTLPIFVGGALRGLTNWMAERKGEKHEDEDLGSGSLFATGLVAGGALMGLVAALWSAKEAAYGAAGGWLKALNLEPALAGHRDDAGVFHPGLLSPEQYQFLGVFFFALLCYLLIRAARKKNEG